MHIQPYLQFNGRCEEAIEFYKAALGAKVQMLMRFKDSPEKHPEGAVTPDMAEKVMHSTLLIGDSVIHATDGGCTGGGTFSGISLSLTANNDADAERRFGALAAGGKVNMPLTKTFFSSKFGMVIDKFGVSWMILVAR